jgi:hypothetical protein
VLDVLAEMEWLAERYAPEIAVPTPAMIDQLRRNLALRVALLNEFGAVPAEEISELVGSSAQRRSSTIDNWRRSYRILAVRWRDQTLVPGFQLLRDGQPDPNLRRVLELLAKQGFGAWQAALWWVLPTPALDGARPVDLLLKIRGREGSAGPEQLLRAANRPEDWF